MRILTDKFSIYLFSMLLLVAVAGCSTKNKDQASKEAQTAASANVLLPVIDSVHLEIKNGKYGLIDRFMVIQNEDLLADYQYKQDYETIAKNYDTTDYQYNYDHPNWHPYYKQTELHTMQSVTKSVTSILLGIAFDQHADYNVNTKVMPLFSDYALNAEDERMNEITIEDLLTMRSGLEWNEGAYDDLSDDCIAMESSKDWISYVLNKPTDTVPGTRFEYNSGASVLIGKIIRIITGKRADEWAEEKLFGPLGITDYYWKETPLGEMDTEGGLYLKAEDLAKIGSLFLNKGKWQNKQIVPESWVDASISPVVIDVDPANKSKIGYGYQWWVPEHVDGKTRIFAGNGYGGQFLMVVPEYDLIVLFNGWNIHERAEKSTWNVLQDKMIPALVKNE